MIAPASPIGTVPINPMICVAEEVKKENFNEASIG
ncbi:hypothetical protein BGP_6592 [Beggiatoa sp. PS]|nr:hypothetical protein BGP_6592 [Beggiatoa sp. PS]